MSDKIVLCSRCSAPCRISTRDGNPGAQPVRLAKGNEKGYCINCAFTKSVLSIETLAAAVKRNGPQIFNRPDVRAAYAGLFRAGCADADVGEIDWEEVIENWELPFKK